MENNELKNSQILNEELKNKTNNLIDMDSLINNLKAEDTKNLSMSKMLKSVYIVLIIVYTAMMLIKQDFNLLRIISDLSFIVSFIMFAAIFIYYEKEYKQIDYSLPMFQMLKKAADRYKLSIYRILIAFIPVIIMDIGLTLGFYDEPFGGNSFNRVIIVQAIYLPVMLLSGYIGFKVWKKKQKPLRDEALKLLKELDE